jgi:hypothetical protein
MLRGKIDSSHFRQLELVTSRAQIGRFRSRAVNRMTLRAIAMRRDIGFDVLFDDTSMAGRTLTSVPPVGWVRSMRFVAQSTRVDVAMYDRGVDWPSLCRNEHLTGLFRLPAMTRRAARCAWIAGVACFDELVAR